MNTHDSMTMRFLSVIWCLSRLGLVLFLLVGTGFVATAEAGVFSAPLTAHPPYALGNATKCRAGYQRSTLAKTKKVTVTLDGKTRTLYEVKRYAGCVWKVVIPTTTTVVRPVTVTTVARPACSPISDEGTCYEPGEYCRDDDHGVSGIAGDGERIVCEDNDGWRWEPA